MASSKTTTKTKQVINHYRFDNGPHRKAMLLSVGDLIRGKRNNDYFITSEYAMCKVLKIDPTHTPKNGEDEGDIKVSVVRYLSLHVSDDEIPDSIWNKEYWVRHDEFIKLNINKINSYNVNPITGREYLGY